MTRQCMGCGGVYAPVQPDGTRYFHVCPPISDADVRAALGLGDDETKWSKKDRLDFTEYPRMRDGHRDENVVPPAPGDDVVTMKRAGFGAADIK